MGSWGMIVVRVIRNNLRWGLGSEMNMSLSLQLLYMRVSSASEWCVGVSSVVRLGWWKILRG